MNNTDIDSQYSINNLTNYKTNIDVGVDIVLSRYTALVIEYLHFIFENNFIQTQENYIFYVIRGYETINHVFLMILYYTQNIDMAYYHGQRSFYFYIEFLNQTSNSQTVFINLSSQDAVQFVYRKTIFEINSEIRKNTIISQDCTNKIEIIRKHGDIIKNIIYYYLYNLIHTKYKIEYFGKRMVDSLKNITDNMSGCNQELVELYINILNEYLVIDKYDDTKTDINIDNYHNKIVEFLLYISKYDIGNVIFSQIESKLLDNDCQKKMNLESSSVMKWLFT